MPSLRHGELYGPLPPRDRKLCDLCRQPIDTPHVTACGIICTTCFQAPEEDE